MVRRIIIDNGIPKESIHTTGRSSLTLPGFYRPTKNWDLIVVHDGKLVAAVEFKSQVGPSFGNNFNNRVEEALGNATDLNTAFREGAFGESHKPFVGYVFVLEACPASTRTVRFTTPHFAALPEFERTSYAARYEILCRKLVHEQLYDAAALLLTGSEHARSGDSESISELTSVQAFARDLAGHVAGAVS